MNKGTSCCLKILVFILSISLLLIVLFIGIICKSETNILVGNVCEKDEFSQSDVQCLEDIYQVSFPEETEFNSLSVYIDTHKDTRMTLELTITLPHENKDDFITAWVPRDYYYKTLTSDLQQEQIFKSEMSTNFTMSLFTREDYENFEKCESIIQPEIVKIKRHDILICSLIALIIALAIILLIIFIKRNHAICN